MDNVMAMSHLLLAKLLSFTTDIEDEIRVIRIPIHMTELHTIEGAPMNY
jgi:hypothetical protein